MWNLVGGCPSQCPDDFRTQQVYWNRHRCVHQAIDAEERPNRTPRRPINTPVTAPTEIWKCKNVQSIIKKGIPAVVLLFIDNEEVEAQLRDSLHHLNSGNHLNTGECIHVKRFYRDKKMHVENIVVDLTTQGWC